MANRRGHSRRPDQFVSDQADELSRVPFSIFLSGRLVYSFVTLPPIAVIFFYFRDYLVLPSTVMYVLRRSRS